MRGVSRSQNGTRPLCEPPPAPRMDSRQMLRVAIHLATWEPAGAQAVEAKPTTKPPSGSHSCAREKLYEQLRTAILTCASHSQLSTHPHNLPKRHPTVFCMLISPRSLAPSQLLLLCSALLCSFAASHAPQLHHPPPPPLNTHHFLFKV